MLPPSNFKEVKDILWCVLCERAPGFKRSVTRSGRRLSGIKYEKRAHEHFQTMYGDMYVRSPWLMFREVDEKQVRYAQPDALLFDFTFGTITIVEYKYQHCELAWWQMHRLYKPLLQHLFGSHWEIKTIEVVKWYDPATHFPDRVQLCPALDSAPKVGTGVHIWKP